MNSCAKLPGEYFYLKGGECENREEHRDFDKTSAMVAAAGSAAAMRDLETAERYLQAALAQAPESPDVLAAAGRVYRAAGKNRKAEQYFRASLAAQARGTGQADQGYPVASSAWPGSGTRPFNPFAGITGPGTQGAALRGDRLPMPAASARLAAAPLPALPPAAPVASSMPVQAPAAAPE